MIPPTNYIWGYKGKGAPKFFIGRFSSILSYLYCYSTNEQAMQVFLSFLHSSLPLKHSLGLVSASPELWVHTACGPLCCAWYARPMHLTHSKDFRKPLISLSNIFFFIPFCQNNVNPCCNNTLWKDQELSLFPSSPVICALHG